jgi:hypothetical protein
MTPATRQNDRRFFTWILRILYVITLLCFGYFLFTGLSFYLTPLNERPHQELFRVLKPGGLRSHGLGIIGSLMLVLSLFYSLRKRWSSMRNMGSLSNWLNVHIFFGICGPLFIILHSTLKLNGLVSVAFWAMVAVALSGVLGRYLYLQIPRNIMGHELSLQEVEELNKNLTVQLQQQFRLDAQDIRSIEAEFINTKTGTHGTGLILLDLIAGDLKRFLKSNRIKKLLTGQYHLPTPETAELLRLLKQQAQINRRIMLWNKIHQLFHYWHVFHKPFAVLMYIVMIIHIGISVWLGYRWIF